MTPTVSVVIPVFNGGDESRLAIESALAQRDCDVEVIVVNDGSTDHTAEILNSYRHRIVMVDQPNQGIARTRNEGLRHARGQWVAFLDNDDEWLPDKLSRQLKAAERTGAEVVYTNTLNVGDTGRVDELRYSSPESMPVGDLYERLLMDNFLVTSSIMVRRSCLEQVGGFTESPATAEDWDLWLKLAAAGCQFAAVPEPLTRYHWRPGSYSRNYDRMRMLRQTTIQRALKTPRGQRLPWHLRRQALASSERCSAWFLATVAPHRAVRWYLTSLWQWPFSTQSWKGVVKGCLGRS